MWPLSHRSSSQLWRPCRGTSALALGLTTATPSSSSRLPCTASCLRVRQCSHLTLQTIVHWKSLKSNFSCKLFLGKRSQKSVWVKWLFSWSWLSLDTAGKARADGLLTDTWHAAGATGLHDGGMWSICAAHISPPVSARTDCGDPPLLCSVVVLLDVQHVATGPPGLKWSPGPQTWMSLLRPAGSTTRFKWTWLRRFMNKIWW